MASKLSFFRRQQLSLFRRRPATGKPRNRRLRAEQLEDRLSPAANLLVTTTIASTEQVLREFTPGGNLVRTALLPVVSGVHEPARDLIYDQNGKVHVYSGTFDPALSSYNLAGGGWTQRTHPGWSTVNQITYGGIGLLGDYVYVTDMTTFGEPADEAKGRGPFQPGGRHFRPLPRNGSAARPDDRQRRPALSFERQHRQGLRPKHVRPEEAASRCLPETSAASLSMPRARSLPSTWSEQVYRLSASGAVLGSVTLTGVSDPMDIDLSGDGRVAIGTTSGHVVQMSEDLTGITTFLAGSQRAFVAFGPDEAASPAGPTPVRADPLERRRPGRREQRHVPGRLHRHSVSAEHRPHRLQVQGHERHGDRGQRLLVYGSALASCWRGRPASRFSSASSPTRRSRPTRPSR